MAARTVSCHCRTGKSLGPGEGVFLGTQPGFRADSVHGKTQGKKGHTSRGRTSWPAVVDQCGLRGERTGWVLVLHLPGRTERQSVGLAANLVLDGLPAHKTTLVKTYVASTNGPPQTGFPGDALNLNPTDWFGAI